MEQTRRCVVKVIADLPPDMTAARFRRLVDHRMRVGGPEQSVLTFPMAFEVWPGSLKRQRKEFRKLLVRYIDLDRQHAQAAKRPPTFDAADGPKLAEDILMHWDAGREQGLFWLAHFVDLAERLLEGNIRDDAEGQLLDALRESVRDRNILIAQYELMVHKLLEVEVTKH